MTRNDQAFSVGHPVLKVLTAWLAVVGISSWAEAAAFIGFLYTLCLMGEWVWKRIVKPYCARRGWIERRKRGDGYKRADC
jgi:hypothetical protein